MKELDIDTVVVLLLVEKLQNKVTRVKVSNNPDEVIVSLTNYNAQDLLELLKSELLTVCYRHFPSLPFATDAIGGFIDGFFDRLKEKKIIRVMDEKLVIHK